MPSPSLTRTLKAIENLVNEQEWYAAHQKYRTSAVRLLKANTPESVSDAASLLFEGSRLLLQRSQTGSGTDLALMLIKDVLSSPTNPTSYGAETRQKLLQLVVLAGPSGTWRRSIIDAAINHSAAAGDCPTGDPLLHAAVGELLAKEGDLNESSVHLLSACSRDAAKTLAGVMTVWSQQETGPAPLGRYAARGVLGYLELGSVAPARAFLDAFLSNVDRDYPSLKHSTLPSPVAGSDLDVKIYPVQSLNFLQLLVLTCQVGPGGAPAGAGATGGGATPQIGRAAYQAMVGRYSRNVGWVNQAYTKESLAVIAEIYFNIKPPRQSGNLLGDLMGSLFGGGGGGGGGALPSPSPSPAGRGRGGRAVPSPKPAAPGLD